MIPNNDHLEEPPKEMSGDEHIKRVEKIGKV